MISEIWIKTKDKAVRLPVVPSEFERVIDANYETNNVIGLGDVATITLSNSLGTIGSLIALSLVLNHISVNINKHLHIPFYFD